MIYVLLGSYGDIICLLPALKHEYEKTGIKPKLMTHRDYADILDGVSYVEPMPYDGVNGTPGRATEIAKKYDEVKDCSVYAKDYKILSNCNSFLRDSWQKSGCEKPFGSLPLVFNNRNKEREAKLLEQFDLSGKVVLVSLKGKSAPYPYKEKFLELIKQTDYNVIDISDVKAERLYDLLGLFEKAYCLITIDTSTLHLAKAVPDLPVIALFNYNRRWACGEHTGNMLTSMSYDDSINKFDKIREKLKTLKKDKVYFVTSKNPNPDDAEKRRYEFAESTRLTSMQCEYHDYQRGRKSVEGMPYVKDMIDFISDKAEDDDMLVIHNADICFISNLPELLMQKTGFYGAVFSYRMVADKIDKMLDEFGVAQLKNNGGIDLFAFKKWWWVKYRNEFFDMIFGRTDWDIMFRHLIKKNNGLEMYFINYHQTHESIWKIDKHERPDNRHNQKLLDLWFRKFGGNKKDRFIPRKDWHKLYKKVI